MKFHYAAASPYARKAHATAIETGMVDKLEMEPTSPWTDPEGYRDINPVGKVPALVRDDGPALYQSNIICEYFDAHGDNKVYPASGAERWTAMRQLAAADGILDASVLIRMEGMFHEGDAISQKLIDRQELSVAAALDQLEDEADDLNGPVTIGQIAVACALGYRDFRFEEVNWRRDRPKLAAWFETFSKRDSIAGTDPNG
jgi:glutathione S-transferase